MKKTGLKPGGPLSRSSSKGPKRGPVSAASREQRAKAAEENCLACGAGRASGRYIDPAHLCARSLGGCDDALCVVPLCRVAGGGGCHPAFDEGRLDLAPFLEPACRAEVAHCVGHMGLYGALRRISGRNYGERAA